MQVLRKYQVQIFLCIEKIIRRSPCFNASLFLDIIFLCVLHPAKNVSNLFRFLHREKMRANANTPIMVMVLMMMATAMTVEL